MLCEHLQYRLIDVSALKELGQRWIPEVMTNRPKKANKHHALEDIMDSITELKFYQNSMILPHMKFDIFNVGVFLALELIYTNYFVIL